MKGVLEELTDKLGITDVTYEASTKYSFLHPGRQAVVMNAGQEIAYLGQLHPEAADNYSIKDEVYVAVVHIDALMKLTSFDRKYESVAKFPAMTRDLSMVMKKEVLVGQLEAIFKKRGGKLLESMELFDVYEGDQIAEGYKSVAYSLKFRHKDKTLEDAEVTAVVDKILEDLKKLDVELRS